MQTYKYRFPVTGKIEDDSTLESLKTYMTFRGEWFEVFDGGRQERLDTVSFDRITASVISVSITDGFSSVSGAVCQCTYDFSDHFPDGEGVRKGLSVRSGTSVPSGHFLSGSRFWRQPVHRSVTVTA